MSVANPIHKRVWHGRRAGIACKPYGYSTSTPNSAKVTCPACKAK